MLVLQLPAASKPGVDSLFLPVSVYGPPSTVFSVAQLAACLCSCGCSLINKTPPRVPLCSYGTPTASSCTHRDLTDIRNCCWTLIMLVGAVNSVLSSQVLLKLGLSGP
ncbi:hypothetical protein AMECASPLE_018049 [Ameca splendens]|uniref:Uncharacterized protein n=1 Tax=Ameca splendens TaxID=208324 RepID=A0ABV0ZC56_9TELE